jgi:hypothetical protein
MCFRYSRFCLRFPLNNIKLPHVILFVRTTSMEQTSSSGSNNKPRSSAPIRNLISDKKTIIDRSWVKFPRRISRWFLLTLLFPPRLLISRRKVFQPKAEHAYLSTAMYSSLLTSTSITIFADKRKVSTHSANSITRVIYFYLLASNISLFISGHFTFHISLSNIYWTPLIVDLSHSNSSNGSVSVMLNSEYLRVHT